MKKIIAACVATILLSACGGAQEEKKPAKPAGPDYSKMRSIIEVEAVVPANLKIAYQNLFSCRFETAQKKGEDTPELGPKYAVSVLEAVKKDPTAGDKCMAQLNG